ncbi:unnamed protein product [Lupinus luteus]|uniref:Uncharacterized protein n=1 Tax=Lupinus luteus TaxID=3873 RepID=A0AAV1WA74_LUPLU
MNQSLRARDKSMVYSRRRAIHHNHNNMVTIDILNYNLKYQLRQSATKFIANTVRPSLDPKGMEKMISISYGDVIITHDGAIILKNMQLLQPTTKILVDISKS